MPDVADAKRAAAIAAVAEVRAGMLIGLGTGSTVAFALDALGARVRDGLRIEAVATSLATATAARRLGIPVREFAEVTAIDLAIDGVDEIDAAFRAIKGAGGAMLREKVVAASAARMIAIADARKAVKALGQAPVPIEVLPFALGFVTARAEALGARATLRLRADGSRWPSDQGNAILDCAFGAIGDAAALADALAEIPGLLGHGLFLDEIDALYLGDESGGARRIERPAQPVGEL